MDSHTDAVARPIAELAVDEALSKLPGPLARAVADVPVTVTVLVGRATMSLRDVVNLGPASVVELDRAVGEEVEVFIGERLVARGELVSVEGRLAVRLTHIVQGEEENEGEPG
jgi:flagellar motor switch protein FliN/FliY